MFSRGSAENFDLPVTGRIAAAQCLEASGIDWRAGQEGSRIVICLDGNTTSSGIDLRACRVVRLDLPPDQPTKRIVHELDGIDQPVDPNRLLLVGIKMLGAWIDHRPGYVPEMLIGLGTSGIIPTIALALAARLPYHLAWPLEHTLTDSGARRDFLASGQLQGKRVLVVDDQVIHGYALTRFVSTLRDEAADVIGALCLIEDTTGTGRSRIEATGVTLCAVTAI